MFKGKDNFTFLLIGIEYCAAIILNWCLSKLLKLYAYNGLRIQENERHISGIKKPGRFCGQVFLVYIEGSV